MSILAKAIATTGPVSDADVQISLRFGWVCLMVATVLAWALGVFRRGSVAGPVRLGLHLPASPVLIVTIIAGSVWFGSQAGYATYRSMDARPDHAQFDSSHISAADYAVLGIVPCALGWLLLVGGDKSLRQRIPQRLGYSVSHIASGIWKGIVAMTVTLPLVFGSSTFLDLFYRSMKYSHPSEHELLSAMKEASPLVKSMLVIAACVAAPIFEEFFFRGHIQSILARWMTSRPLVLVATPIADSRGTELAPIAVEVGERGPSAGARWLAILMTSFIFALVHPLWMAPLIFLLAICLGYAYERTGNLWTTVTMHAIFNISSTILFLKFM